MKLCDSELSICNSVLSPPKIHIEKDAIDIRITLSINQEKDTQCSITHEIRFPQTLDVTADFLLLYFVRI